MSQPYVGEIRMFGGNFAPLNWALTDGALIPIAQNEALFQLIGTTYGGDGQTTFALPDLRGRFPIHQGTGNGLPARTIGETGGGEVGSPPLQATDKIGGTGATAVVSSAAQIPTVSPFQAVSFIISLFGIFPTQA